MKLTIGKCLIFGTGTSIMKNISVLTMAIAIAMAFFLVDPFFDCAASVPSSRSNPYATADPATAK